MVDDRRGDAIEATVGTSTISDATVNNAGTIEAIDGSTLTIDLGNVADTGTLEAMNTGVLIVDSSVNNSHRDDRRAVRQHSRYRWHRLGR